MKHKQILDLKANHMVPIDKFKPKLYSTDICRVSFLEYFEI